MPVPENLPPPDTAPEAHQFISTARKRPCYGLPGVPSARREPTSSPELRHDDRAFTEAEIPFRQAPDGLWQKEEGVCRQPVDGQTGSQQASALGGPCWRTMRLEGRIETVHSTLQAAPSPRPAPTTGNIKPQAGMDHPHVAEQDAPPAASGFHEDDAFHKRLREMIAEAERARPTGPEAGALWLPGLATGHAYPPNVKPIPKCGAVPAPKQGGGLDPAIGQEPAPPGCGVDSYTLASELSSTLFPTAAAPGTAPSFALQPPGQTSEHLPTEHDGAQGLYAGTSRIALSDASALTWAPSPAVRIQPDLPAPACRHPNEAESASQSAPTSPLWRVNNLHPQHAPPTDAEIDAFYQYQMSNRGHSHGHYLCWFQCTFRKRPVLLERPTGSGQFWVLGPRVDGVPGEVGVDPQSAEVVRRAIEWHYQAPPEWEISWDGF
ncbi:hypothetical protein FN846DRAFT_886857 [Sphaerosporella brunnea]|uniref:Uncharacterized protein n=1 Tax=Sphaerosporella brunnea TaxID=1250544 RepID=A0A5J5F7D8_9PEZI|nr:hypothetical protein FN846DRAFT_886857 [Sphaerosporella brunnea]